MLPRRNSARRASRPRAVDKQRAIDELANGFRNNAEWRVAIRIDIVLAVLRGVLSIERAAEVEQMPVSVIERWIRTCDQYGADGLQKQAEADDQAEGVWENWRPGPLPRQITRPAPAAASAQTVRRGRPPANNRGA